VADQSDPAEAPAQRTARLLREQAFGCQHSGSPLYGELLRTLADDLEAGGPTAAVLDGHLEDSGPSALGLRLMVGVHAQVLSGRAPELAAYYASVSPEPKALDDAGREAIVQVIDSERDEIRRWLLSAPQTNEVGRGAALIGGLLHVVARADLPIRLVEIGTSAGLNLRADHFRVDGTAASYGDRQSPVQLREAWQGSPPPDQRLRIIERVGGDLAPIDPTGADGQLRLTAYVWPDQLDRLARLRGALTLASTVPATLRQERAIDTAMSLDLADDTWTVLWHSVMLQYLTPEERDQVADRFGEVGGSATDRRRFAVLDFEPQRRTPDSPFEFLVTLRTWPGGERTILATVAPHGVPVNWEV
jgi:hypothetical protein